MRRQVGFTLIELVAATALSALLMVGVLHVTVTVNRDAQRASARGTTRAHLAQTESLAALLRHDLVHAHHVRWAPNELHVSGENGLDPRDLTPTHRPARVSYFLQSAGRTTWLVRRQTDRADVTNQDANTTLILGGVGGFGLSDRAMGAEGTATNTSERGLPEALVLTLAMVSAGSDLVEKLIVLH